MTDVSATTDPPKHVKHQWRVDLAVLVGAIATSALSLTYLTELMDNTVPTWGKGLIVGLGMALVVAPLFAWLLDRQRAQARLRYRRTSRNSFVGSRVVSSGPARRVRIVVMGSLSIVAVLVCCSLWGYVATTERMATDDTIIHLAEHQRSLSQRMSRIVYADPFDDEAKVYLTGVFKSWTTETDSLTVLMAALYESDLHGVNAARLTYAESAPARRDFVAAVQRALQVPGSGAEYLAARAAIRSAADHLAPENERLVGYLNLFHQARAKRNYQVAWLVAGLILLSILFMAVFVIEPVVRLLKRQHETVAVRSVEFERLAMVAERTSNAVLITDADRRITWVNDGFARLTGYSADDAVGHIPGELLRVDVTDAIVTRQLDDALAAGKSIRRKVLYRRKDQAARWFDQSIEPLREDGKIAGYIAIQSDVTDIIESRNALEVQSRRLDLIVSSADLGTWEWDIASGDVAFNDQWVRMLGFNRDDVAAHIDTWKLLTHADDVAAVAQEMISHIKGQSPEFRCTQRLRRHDGTWCTVVAAGRVIERSADGRAVRAVGVHLDVSSAEARELELKAAHLSAEAALREVAALRSALDEHSILSVADRDGRIVDVNTGFCRISGYSAEELIGQTHQMQSSGVHSKEFWADVWNTILAGRPWRGEVCNKRKDGSLYWVDSTIAPFIGANGQVEKFVSIRFDITAQRQIDEELQKATALLEEAQALARLGSWSLDRASGKVQWSREIFGLFGRMESDGAPDYADALTDYIETDALTLSAAIEEALTNDTPYSLVLKTSERSTARFVRAEGRARRDAHNHIIGLFGTVMDVTAEVEREEERHQAQLRAEAANRSKSEFLANMSHEIRTPLTAILGYADLLREEAEASQASQSNLQSINTIRRAGEHLLSVINDILDVSKIEAGRMIVEQVETPLPRVLFDVDSLMRSRAAIKKVVLRTTLTSPIPELILSDPTRLRQILVNLVGNAAKFTERGRIDVRAGAENGPSGPMLRIRVDDTGPGLSDEQSAYLFQPFTQADSSVTRRHGGSGLGLNICRRLAQLMGGDVSLAKTEIGVGSSFELLIPFTPVAGAQLVHDLDVCSDRFERETEHLEIQTTVNGRVLLAEDGEDNKLLISHHLRMAGADVTVADNGCEALAAIRQALVDGRPFDLLVSDMQMPEMDGYTLARNLRADGIRIPIMALTAHAMAEDRQKCLDAGCDDYASKPINRAALLAACAQLLALAATSTDIFPMSEAVTTAKPLRSPAGADAAIATTDSGMILVSEFIDHPDLGELVQGFVDKLPGRIARLEDCRNGGQCAELGRFAHQLKGAAGGYGFPTISDAARDVEQGVKSTGISPDTARLLDILLEQCRSAVRAHPAAPELIGVAAVPGGDQ